MVEKREIKKIPIGQIGKNQHKITIADEIELETQYHLDPPLSPKQLAECWLDPSDFLLGFSKRHVAVFPDSKEDLALATVEFLKRWLIPEGLKQVIFEQQSGYLWSAIKGKVLRRYNLTNLQFGTQSAAVHQIKISSRQPLYDQDAHAIRVRNVLRAVKIHYPETFFEHEGCWTSGSCPIKIQEALLKLAEETHKGASQ